MFLPVVLIARAALFPDMPPVQVDRFASERECRAAGAALDSSTLVILVLSCEVEA